MEKKLSLLYPEGYHNYEQDKLTDFGFVESLGIESMIQLKTQNYLGFPNLKLNAFFTKNTDVLKYRIDIVEDIIENDGLLQTLLKAIPYIQNIYDMRKVLNSDSTIESNLLCIRTLEMYIEVMEFLEEGLKNGRFQSEGMKSLKAIVMERVESQEFSQLKTELRKLHTNISHIKSITVGINMDGTLCVKEAGVVSINTQEYREGNLIDKLIHKKNKEDKFLCMTSLVPTQKVLDAKEQTVLSGAMHYALNTIFSKSIRSWEPVVQRYFSNQTDFLIHILEDIRFLTSAVKFILDMKEKGLPMCKPVIKEIGEKACTLKDAYNPMVALKVQQEPIVTNDFEFDEKGMFYIITGPNHGGKSVFAYSIGMIQALFQLGLFVPAVSAEISPVSNIFTHFPASDENNYGKGRLESECDRLSKTLSQITEDSLMIMDEAFASTSGTEAGYIASEVITGLGVIGCRGLFVTHIHDLPLKVEEFNHHPENKGKIDNLAAQMENREDGRRSYKLKRIMPDGLSYAKDIAKKYGLELEKIIENVKAE